VGTFAFWVGGVGRGGGVGVLGWSEGVKGPGGGGGE
jgi:hypothetical protein